MKHKVSELEGAALDAAVGKALGLQYSVERGCYLHSVRDTSGNERFHEWRETPSTRWEHGGPIIERERIELRFCKGWEEKDTSWESAANPTGYPEYELEFIEGPTALIAAMRAYVASKFGAEVELP